MLFSHNDEKNPLFKILLAYLSFFNQTKKILQNLTKNYVLSLYWMSDLSNNELSPDLPFTYSTCMKRSIIEARANVGMPGF